MSENSGSHPKSIDIGFIHLNYPKPLSISEQSAATEYIRYMNNNGHDVTVYCPEKPDNSRDIADDLKTRFLDVDPSFPKHGGEELNRSILARDDLTSHSIIHCYTGRAIPALGKISRENDINTVVTLNAYNSVCPKNDLLFLDSNSCDSRGNIKCALCTLYSNTMKFGDTSSSLISEIIGIAHTQTNQLRDIRMSGKSQEYVDDIDAYHVFSDHSRNIYKKFNYSSDKFHTVPIPLNESFKSKVHEIPKEPYKLLYVGRLSKAKGVDRLPKILHLLVNKYNCDLKLSIVGDSGELNGKINKMFGKYELRDHVFFKGFIPNSDLPNVYKNHDLFIYPGRVDEAFGRVFLESLASSTPIVSSNVGAVSEIIGGGGVIVDGDQNEFAREIFNLIYDKEVYMEKSSSAYNKSKEYELEKIGGELKNMYKKLNGDI